MADLAIAGPSQLMRPEAERSLTERYADQIHAGWYREFGKVMKQPRSDKRGSNAFKPNLTLIGMIA